MLPEFDLWTSKTLPEALAQLSSAGSEAVPLSGGTNVIPDLRSGRHTAKVVLDISRLKELHGIRRQDGHLVAGGAVTLAELLASPLVSEHGKILQQAGRLFANPLIRNRATVAGNLVDASPAADTAPALLALDAEVELQSQAGSRTVPLQEFFVGVRKTVRRPEELLVSVSWPIAKARTAYAYYKLGLRQADAISVVSVAIRLEVDANGLCQDARIALGSVAPRPLRALAAEESLRGQAFTDASYARASKLAAEAVSPISDLRASGDYRRRMVGVLVQRLLKQAADEFRKRE
ncbi:MAG TPA: xanthine dehydrogenase family protein subunit M [Anaerolineaceae bacterium]|nr:xanthine dehydrogenase family protein subunit M [Anaerolineaceae bacterium]